MRQAFHYHDGRWVRTEDLKISAFDLAVVRGFGVFDFLRTYRNIPFMLDAHLDRLFNSASLLGLAMPIGKKGLSDLIRVGIRKNSFSETTVRIVLTGGVGEDAMSQGTPSLILIFSECHAYPDRYYQKGVEIITYDASRSFPLAKSLNYLTGIMAMKEARQARAVEALYIEQDRVLECTTSNFFAAIDGVLVTPKENILFGVTRQVVLDLARNHDFLYKERVISASEIGDFQEAFITASNKEIMPVVKIGNQRVGDGKVGPITKRLIREFQIIIKGLAQLTSN